MAPSTTTTPTTTTLPSPIAIDETRPVGPAAVLGRVLRVPVLVVAPGHPVIPPPSPTDPGAARTLLIGYRQFGSGPALVAIAGEDASMSWWDPTLLETLAQHFEVTIFDLPGVGFSSPLRSAPSLSLYAGATAGLIGALGLHRPVLLGWGLGGQVALEVAEGHPDAIGDLVVVDSGAGGSGEVGSLLQARAELASPMVTPALVAPYFFPPAQLAAETGYLDALGEVAPDVVVATTVVAEARLEAELSASNRLASDLGRVSTPTLVVCGSEDEIFPEADSVLLAARLLHAHLLVIKKAGYGAIFEHEHEFLDSLLSLPSAAATS